MSQDADDTSPNDTSPNDTSTNDTSSDDVDSPLLFKDGATGPEYANTPFEETPTRGGVMLRGACPRCQHQMELLHIEKMVDKSILHWGARRRTEPVMVRMYCTCTEDHPERPADDEGCGAYWERARTQST